MNKKSIVLFSGGLDSTTCLAVSKAKGFETYALSFNYGQKHDIEIERAKKIAEEYKIAGHKILTLPIDKFGASALTDQEISVPDFNKNADTIPNTYVPARNTIFLSYALGFAEVVGANDIYIGANAVDYSGYPDCRPEYLRAFEILANLATKSAIQGQRINIHAPLLHLSKAEIILLGLDIGVDYQRTISCYRADKEGRACGSCDSCVYRKKGFSDARVEDPTLYVEN